jgi:hypothetical protein
MVNSNDGEVLKDTFLVYGIVLCVLFSLFCFVRLRFPRAYTIRRWAGENLKVCSYNAVFRKIFL